jgi:predicted RNA-binding protein with RPS1 domain
VVTKVSDFGCFVQLEGFSQRLVGMVHVSCIKEGIVRNAFDAVRVNQ